MEAAGEREREGVGEHRDDFTQSSQRAEARILNDWRGEVSEAVGRATRGMEAAGRRPTAGRALCPL